MGIVGRYIDVLSDEQRDRVIEAKGWDREFVSYDDPSCRCLVGHAEDWDADFVSHDHLGGKLTSNSRNHRGIAVYNQFPRLCKRFGEDRIIRLCKVRAAGTPVSVQHNLPATLTPVA